MYCFYCGDCCRRLSPLSDGPCPHLQEVDGFVLCAIYDQRPKRCADHKYPFRFCPIGIQEVGIGSTDQARQRIDQGWERARRGLAP